MSAYKLSKLSGVPQSTIADICSCKTTIINCKASTLYKIAKTLNVTVDYWKKMKKRRRILMITVYHLRFLREMFVTV
ncbi:MAG: helix-turn-helix domain-containing protein [Blautia sp.]